MVYRGTFLAHLLKRASLFYRSFSNQRKSFKILPPGQI